MIKLGSKVRDSITGFQGIATGRTEYLYGCVRITITPDTLKDGATIPDEWFDEQRVEMVEDRPVETSRHSSATSGGPQRDPATPKPPL